MNRKIFIISVLLLLAGVARANRLFIPMDAKTQTNHLKAYGIAFAVLKEGTPVDWLLNYKGGSFVMNYSLKTESACKQRHVSFQKITDAEYAGIVKKINEANFNGAIVKLEKPPKIAVYTPPSKEPWDDAVTLGLTYAEIPFDKIYADEVLAGDLDKYDWLHLHHEDFTGQYGKFWGAYRYATWYVNDKKALEALAQKNGFKKVSQMQLAVVKKIREFVNSGGNLFAMCSATDTYDIALAAEGTDICDTPYDGDPMDPKAQSKLNFSNCFAFRNFTVSTNPMEYEYSNIDNTNYRAVTRDSDYFKLVNFKAKLDQVGAMLCQNHTNVIKGFMGQTTAFRKEVIKPNVLVMGDFAQANEARYIHGEYGKGTWTFYGGHDPEDYQHNLGNPPTDLADHPSSPGYRLILNNVLSPAAKRPIVPDFSIMGSRVKIAPDVSSNQLSISLAPLADGTDSKIKSIVIVTSSGEQVYSHAFNAEKVNVDFNDIPSGMFLVKVNGQYAGKVVKN